MFRQRRQNVDESSPSPSIIVEDDDLQECHDLLNKNSLPTSPATHTLSNSGPRKAMGKDEIAKDEGRLKKVAVRILTGLIMVSYATFSDAYR